MHLCNCVFNTSNSQGQVLLIFFGLRKIWMDFMFEWNAFGLKPQYGITIVLPNEWNRSPTHLFCTEKYEWHKAQETSQWYNIRVHCFLVVPSSNISFDYSSRLHAPDEKGRNKAEKVDPNYYQEKVSTCSRSNSKSDDYICTSRERKRIKYHPRSSYSPEPTSERYDQRWKRHRLKSL